MNMTPKKSKSETIKSVLIFIITILLVVGISYFTYRQYHQYKIELANKNTAQAIIDANNAKIAADRESKFNADINRLISICYDSQTRYDALSTKDKAKTYRPNCDLSPR